MTDFDAGLKESLRRDALAARRELDDRGLRNRAIANRLSVLPAFRDADAILSYVSKPEEADTRGIIEGVLRQGRNVFAPRVISGQRLEWARVETLETLASGAHGVLEPPGTVPASPVPTGAVALIPGVAYDRQGNRLGWGQGYFDRFLSSFDGRAVGLAFDCQLYEELPTEPHDRPVAFVVTEHETIITAVRRSP